MDREEKKKFAEEVDKAVMSKASNPDFWMRRQRWDEWGSPVGLSLGWALFIIPLGFFLYLLHLSGLLR